MDSNLINLLDNIDILHKRKENINLLLQILAKDNNNIIFKELFLWIGKPQKIIDQNKAIKIMQGYEEYCSVNNLFRNEVEINGKDYRLMNNNIDLIMSDLYIDAYKYMSDTINRKF